MEKERKKKRILKQKLQLNNNDEWRERENESCVPACVPVRVCVAMTRHECDTCVDFSIFP